MATFFDKTKTRHFRSEFGSGEGQPSDNNPASFSPHLPEGYYKIGDIIHIKIDLSNIADLSTVLPEDRGNKKKLTEFFKTFFSFKSDSDPGELDMTLLEAAYVSTLSGYELKYLFNLSGLNSGDKEVNIYAFKQQEEDGVIIQGFSTEAVPDLNKKKINTVPLTFYLHQSSSVTDHFQKNIANEGIEERTGLDRDKVNFPAYLPVGLQPINPFVTRDVALWEVIRDGTEALSFKNYSAFMNYIFCGGRNPFEISDHEEEYRSQLDKTNNNLSLPFNNVDTYRALKVATEAFVMATINVAGDLTGDMKTAYNKYLERVNKKAKGNGTIRILPYLALIREKLPDLDIKSNTFDDALTGYLTDQPLLDACYGLLRSKLKFPCFLELIWSYWHEESMMVQGITTIARRFQNIRGEGAVDPLANVEIGPLRPLNNLMWGYVQDEQHRLTVRRRAYEYDHHYGISLQGNAAKGMRPADSRSKFIEAFHTLLNLCIKFYHQYDDTTVVADGFPIMNALKEVHMILSEGAHNQFGDLPSTARIEMLMQQYILARPEFREFLPTRQMVAYPEAWMDRVGVLNQMHSWTKTNVMHFRDLGKYGEQLILGIRFGAWSDVINRDQAANWAIFWRPQIQNYIHSYRAVAGIDLTREDGVIDTQQPSVHLLRRLNEQNSKVKV